MKLNTDESVLGNPSQVGAWGVLGDCNGRWIKGFSHNIRITNYLLVEFLVLNMV